MLRSPLPIDTGLDHHTLEINRDYGRGTMKIDNQPTVSAKSPGKMIGLNSHTNLYVGGLDTFEMELLPVEVNFTNGFQGKPSSYKLYSVHVCKKLSLVTDI